MRRVVVCSFFVCASCVDDPLVALPGRVLGTLCDVHTGDPAPGIAFQVEVAGEVVTGVSDDEGQAAAGGLEEGEGVLTAFFDEPRSFPVGARDNSTALFEDPACRAIPPAPGTGDVDGVICNRHTGSVVKDATITVLLDDGGTQSTATNADGSFFLFDVPAGAHALIVESETYRRTYAVIVEEGETFTVPGEECENPDGSSGLLSGVFCDPDDDGAPLRGADVLITDVNGEEHRELTDDEGKFLAGPLPPGRAEIAVVRGELALLFSAVVVGGEEATVSSGGVCAGETCSETSVSVDPPALPELLLVVDRSSSMNLAAPGYGTTRWLGVKDALVRVTAAVERRVAFGLMLFPAVGSEDGCSGAVVDSAPTFENATPIADILDAFDTEPLGATPTASSLFAAREFLRDNPSSRPRAVLLATDGGPNCNLSLDPDTCRCSSGLDSDCRDAAFSDPVLAAGLCLDDDNAVEAVAALHDDGVDTYVVGVPGVENFSDVLNAMAEAGGTRLDGPLGFYLARDSQSLEAAITDIGRRVASCSVDVPTDTGVDLVGAARLELRVDGQKILRDATGTDGFDVADADTLLLFGSACDALGEGGTVAITTCSVDLDVGGAQ